MNNNYMYVFTQYNDDYIRITKKLNPNKQQSVLPTKSTSFTDEQKKVHSDFCNISRTKNKIKSYILANDWNYFATWTVDSKLCDRYSLQFTQDKMHKLMKKYKRKYKDFKFIFITENHKDGAFHFHGVVSGMSTDDLYLNKNNYLSSHIFDELGFNSFSKIVNINGTANYILKYITKHCIKNEHNQVYFCSRGLKSSTSYSVNINCEDDLLFKNGFDNGFIKCKDFLISQCSKEELLLLTQINEKRNNFLDF